MSEAEFMQHYEKLADPIFRHCFFRLYDRDRAREVTQETFTRVWKYAQQDGKHIKNVKAFTYRTATNLVIDEARKRKRFSPQSLDALYEEYDFEPGEDSEASAIENRAMGRILLESLEELEEEQYREVLKMRFVEDMQPKEIAEVLGTNRNTVSVRLTRAMQALRDQVQNRT